MATKSLKKAMDQSPKESEKGKRDTSLSTQTSPVGMKEGGQNPKSRWWRKPTTFFTHLKRKGNKPDEESKPAIHNYKDIVVTETSTGPPSIRAEPSPSQPNESMKSLPQLDTQNTHTATDSEPSEQPSEPKSAFVATHPSIAPEHSTVTSPQFEVQTASTPLDQGHKAKSEDIAENAEDRTQSSQTETSPDASSSPDEDVVQPALPSPEEAPEEVDENAAPTAPQHTSNHETTSNDKDDKEITHVSNNDTNDTNDNETTSINSKDANDNETTFIDNKHINNPPRPNPPLTKSPSQPAPTSYYTTSSRFAPDRVRAELLAASTPSLRRTTTAPPATSSAQRSATATYTNGGHRVLASVGFRDGKGAWGWRGERSADWEYPLRKTVKGKKVLASYAHC